MQTKSKNRDVIYGRLSEAARIGQPDVWGSRSVLFTDWGDLHVTGVLVRCITSTPYAAWAEASVENLCVIESGRGTIEFNGQQYPIRSGIALKVFPGQAPTIHPDGEVVLLSIQMPTARKRWPGEDLSKLAVVDREKVAQQVYEYEALGQEIFTPAYRGGLGLLTFTFPIREIPFHIHPRSDRLIRMIDGKGWTFAEPNLYEMSGDTFTLFPRGAVHTNGPVPGEIYRVWAFQLPWVPSGIDEENIAGHPHFVKYVGTTPPRKLWKQKEDFDRVIARLRQEER